MSVCCSNVQGLNYGFELIGFERGGGGEGVNLYLVSLYYTISRALELGCKRIDLGYTADVSKRKFGADRIKQTMYVQVADFFNQAQLGTI